MFSKYLSTTGFTRSANNLIVRIVFSCGMDPTGVCNIKRDKPNVSIVSMILFATVSGLPTYNAPFGPASRAKLFSLYKSQPRSLANTS